jgi:hypothetical protein
VVLTVFSELGAIARTTVRCHPFGLVQGLNEWRNIQDIVRLTFKAFHDVLKAQGDAIKKLEKALDSKSDRREVAAALAAKANAADLSVRLHDYESQLMRKADVKVKLLPLHWFFNTCCLLTVLFVHRTIEKLAQLCTICRTVIKRDNVTLADTREGFQGLCCIKCDFQWCSN